MENEHRSEPNTDSETSNVEPDLAAWVYQNLNEKRTDEDPTSLKKKIILPTTPISTINLNPVVDLDNLDRRSLSESKETENFVELNRDAEDSERVKTSKLNDYFTQFNSSLAPEFTL